MGKNVAWHGQTNAYQAGTSQLISDFKGMLFKGADQKRLWTPLARRAANQSKKRVTH